MRNPTYEQALTKQGVSFTYLEEVPLAAIDVRKGLANQARLSKPLDEALAEQYASAFRDGNDFPPLVLARPGPGAAATCPWTATSGWPAPRSPARRASTLTW